ncbi:hypothetical protein DM02DRAFT_412806 [Periconia macrospinosa]|uniref:Uncharacterized protein n=1 Tax=Periconia macrospinosa TaxID=97972 RepID=A0A2V1CYK8_9PLEO|nr:hypothetical protein DM02DRAFT_412806 [Periconia macrospinosa]
MCDWLKSVPHQSRNSRFTTTLHLADALLIRTLEMLAAMREYFPSWTVLCFPTLHKYCCNRNYRWTVDGYHSSHHDATPAGPRRVEKGDGALTMSDKGHLAAYLNPAGAQQEQHGLQDEKNKPEVCAAPRM